MSSSREKCLHCGAAIAAGQNVCPECGNAAPAPSEPTRSKGPPAATVVRDKQKDFGLVGKTLAGKYKVLGVLGQGGFGTVYRVEITAGMVGEQLALKILPQELSSHTGFRSQFLNEIRVAMRLVDRSIAQIRDVGTIEGDLLYYTMDLCPGVTLKQLLAAEKKLPVTRTLLIVLNVLRGLQTAHAAGVIHRDLKPANIMVQSQGGKDTIRILDFGIATALGAEGDLSRGFAGSPHYMPPEQFMGEQLGFYTDTYALGVVMYECISGEKPYSGVSAQEVFKNLKAGGPTPLQDRAPEALKFPGLVELVARALEKNPTRRFQSTRELFDAINDVLKRSTTTAASPAAPTPAPRAPIAAAADTTSGDDARAATLERIRRRRAGQVGRRPTSHVGAIAAATFLLGSVFAGIFFHREIIAWWSNLQGEKPDTPTLAERASVTSPVEPTPPATTAPEDNTRTTPPPKPFSEEKALAALELKALIELWLSEATRALAENKPETALEKATAVLGRDPGNGSAHRIHGLAALQALDFKKAGESLATAQSLLAGKASDAELVSVLVGLAEVRMEGSPPLPVEAESLAKQALKKSPREPAVLAVLARALESQGKREEAKKVLTAAAAGKIASPQLERIAQKIATEEIGKLRAEADSLLALGENSQARAILAEALKLARNTPGAEQLALEGRLLAAEVLVDLNSPGAPPSTQALATASTKLAGACEKLAQAGDESGTLSACHPARLALARLHAESGEAATVHAHLGEVVKTKDPVLLTGAARVLTRLAEQAAARPDKVRALTESQQILGRVLGQDKGSEASHPQAHFLLGVVYLRLGDVESREERYKQALQSFANADKAGLMTVELFENWATTFDRTGNLMRAAQLYRSAYELAPSPAACLKAVDYFLQANPRSPEARELLKEGRAKFRQDATIAAKLAEVSP